MPYIVSPKFLELIKFHQLSITAQMYLTLSLFRQPNHVRRSRRSDEQAKNITIENALFSAKHRGAWSCRERAREAAASMIDALRDDREMKMEENHWKRHRPEQSNIRFVSSTGRSRHSRPKYIAEWRARAHFAGTPKRSDEITRQTYRTHTRRKNTFRNSPIPSTSLALNVLRIVKNLKYQL